MQQTQKPPATHHSPHRWKKPVTILAAFALVAVATLRIAFVEAVDPAPTCNGQVATIYVDSSSVIVGGPQNGQNYMGSLQGTPGPDVMVGTMGNDALHGGNGNDTQCGGAGNDTLNGENGDDTLLGEDGNDFLEAGEGNDNVVGGSGNDHIKGNNGDDLLCGEDGNDYLEAIEGNDRLDGGEQTDTDHGGNGTDVCHRGEFNDQCETVNSGPLAACAAFVGSSSASSTSSSASSTSTSSSSSVSSSSTSSSSSLAACMPTDAGLVAYWKFNEGTGTTVMDSTAFDNQGMLQNGAMWTASTAPVSFPNPYAGTFDGTNDHVMVSNTTGLPAGSGARTIALWMNQDMIQQQSTLVSLGNGATSDQKFIVMMGTEPAAGPVYLFTDGINAANNVTLSGSQIPTAGWHHLAFSFDGTMWKYYLDGVLKHSGTFSVPINTVTNAVELASRHDATTGHFDGSLDDVRIYSSALSDAAIAALAAGMCDASGSSSSSSSSSSVSTSSSSSVSTSSSSSVAVAPFCQGVVATIYVNSSNVIVGGPQDGQTYLGTLNGTNGNDVMVGTAGADIIEGSNGDDRMTGAGGDDQLRGNNGNDLLCGFRGNDDLEGNIGDDSLDAGPGTDSNHGGMGTDTCRRGETNDTCETTSNAALAACATIADDTDPE